MDQRGDCGQIKAHMPLERPYPLLVLHVVMPLAERQRVRPVATRAPAPCVRDLDRPTLTLRHGASEAMDPLHEPGRSERLLPPLRLPLPVLPRQPRGYHGAVNFRPLTLLLGVPLRRGPLPLLPALTLLRCRFRK